MEEVEERPLAFNAQAVAERIRELEKGFTALESNLADLTWRFNEWTDTTP